MSENKPLQSITSEFEQLLDDCDLLFSELKVVQDLTAEYKKDDPSRHRFECTFVSSEQETKIAGVKDSITRFGNRLISAMETSPLILKDEIPDMRMAVRRILAAVRLRGLYFANGWGDEGTGWRESESDYIEAVREFEDCVTRLRGILPMLASPSDQTDLPVPINSQVRTKPNTAFVMMQIDNKVGKLEDVKEGVKEIFREFGVVAARADEIEHSDSITQRILDEIQTSEFLFADLSGERPSVYYEVGYAHALGKRVIMYREAGTRLHFDLSVHNVKEYSSVTQLKAELRNRLEAVTGHMVKQ